MPWLGLPVVVCVHGCVVVIVRWYMYCVALSVAVCHHVFRVTVCDCITVSALYTCGTGLANVGIKCLSSSQPPVGLCAL